MNIKIATQGNLDKFVCTTPNGASITLGSTPDEVGPMQAILMSIAGCSTIDIVMILKKMRQPIDNISVDVVGERVDDHPRVFHEIKLIYSVFGALKDEKVKQAIDSSLEKYCSVAKMLEKSCTITSSYLINP